MPLFQRKPCTSPTKSSATPLKEQQTVVSSNPEAPYVPVPMTASRPEPVLFPFDGSCEKSRSADLTLQFSDGSVLKAQSLYLAEASPVLKKAVNGMKTGATMDVDDDSREAWVVLLNLLHPGRRLGMPQPLDFSTFRKTEALAALAQKYSVGVLYDYVDAGVSMVVDSTRAPLPDGFGSSYLEYCLSPDRCLFNFLKLAASHELHASKKACLRYLKTCLRAASKKSSQERNCFRNEIGSSMAEFLRNLSNAGHSDTAAWIAQEVFHLFTL